MMAFRPVSKDYSAVLTPQLPAKAEPAVPTRTISPVYEVPRVPVEPVKPQIDVPRVPSIPVPVPPVPTPVPRIPLPRIPVEPRIPVPDLPGDDGAIPSIDLPRVPVEPVIPIHLPPADDGARLPSIDLGPKIPVEPMIPIPRMADLTVLSIEPDKKKIAFGETVEFKFAIKNIGTKSAKFTYAFYPDYASKPSLPFRILPGSIAKVKPVVSGTVVLAPGETLADTVRYTYPALSPLPLPGSILPASVRPAIVADYGDNVPEWNEDNNMASTTVLLYKPGTEVKRPDLTAEVTSAGREFEVGETVDFDVVIQNIGTQDLLTADFDIDFGDGTDVEHYNHFFELGQTWASTVGHKFAEPGTYVVSVVADPSNAAIESNERNNRDLVRVTVVEAPVVSFQCSDGIDNDQDGLVDEADPGCDAQDDDDEFNEVEPVFQCSDGIDNDQDGLVDLDDPGCDAQDDDVEFNEPVLFACSDGVDNDQDGAVDMQDVGCDSQDDDDESDEVVVVTPYCSDQLDNDGDGLVDMDDPGCESAEDDDEFNEVEPVEDSACSDGLDNDEDGLVDLDDPGCESSEDDDETDEVVVVTPYCSDGLDNDGDGLVDMDDPGCESAEDDDEFNEVEEDPVELFACSDGLDNDEDGLVDMDDPGCESAEDTDETDEDEEDPVENMAPVPVLLVTPLNGTAPLNVSIDGSGSHDPDGAIATYSWVVTGPAGFVYSELDVPGTPGTLGLEFVAAGDYHIMLIVADSEGLANSAEEIVSVAGDGEGPGDDVPGNETGGNLAPVPVLNITPMSGTAPLNVTLDGSGSHDDDGNISSHSWIVTGPAGYVHMDMNVTGAPASKTLEFTAVGNYSVMLVVEDNEGLADSAEAVVVVSAGSGDGSGDDDADGSSAPSISQRSVKDVTSTSAKITWRTDIDADSKVEYGTEEDDLDEEKDKSSREKSHTIELTGLSARTRYYYKMISCSEGNKCTEVGPYYFTTLAAGSSTGGSDDEDDESTWDDLFAQNAALFDSSAGNSDAAAPAVIVTTQQDQETGEIVEVIYAQTQYIEVEEEVCKFRLLWWCIWKDVVMKKIPIPALTSGVQFFV